VLQVWVVTLLVKVKISWRNLRKEAFVRVVGSSHRTMPGAKGKGKAAPAKAPCELGGKIGGV